MKPYLTVVRNEEPPKKVKLDTKALFSGDHEVNEFVDVETRTIELPASVAAAVVAAPRLSTAKILAYLSIYVGWGTTYLAIRVAVQSMGPATFLGIRYLLAAAVLLPFVIFTTKREQISLQGILHSSLQGVLLLCFGLLPTAYSEKTLASNITAIIIGCAPIAFAIFDRLINGTKIRNSVKWGLVFGVTGVFIIGLSKPADGAVTVGAMILVACGMGMWSFSSVVSRKLKPLTSPLANVFMQYLAAGIAMAAFALLFENFNISVVQTMTKPALISLLYIALGPSLISYTAYLWLLKTEPSSRVSTYAFVNPVVAVIAGALILGESAGGAVLAALALVCIGTWMNFRK